MAADNVSLGRFDLVGIPPAPRGVPQIEVTFDIDANGILKVTARDLATGKEQAIRITAPTKLSREEIERMVKEAEQFAEQDRRRREEAELRNEADSLAYTAEKTLGELREKLSEEERKGVEKAVGELREALAGKEVAKIREKMESLKRVLGEATSRIYRSSGKVEEKK